MIRSEVSALYSPIYDEFMLSTFNEESQIHPQIFQVIDDHTKEYKVDDLSGLGEWVDANEGEGGGYETPVLGYPKTFTQAKFWKKLQYSYESVDQDEYFLLNKQGDAKQLGRGARALVEKKTAEVLADGFSTDGPDGVYLFHDQHPKSREETAVYHDNLLSGAFSHDALEDAEQQIAQNFFDMKGIPIDLIENPLLVYPPEMRGAVKRVLDDRALEQPDTTLRNINQFAGRYKPVEWRYLSSSLAGTATNWFIVFPELGFLKIIWSARPHFSAWIDDDLEYYNFKGRMLCDVGATNWRCAFGCTGL